jgi:ectoine hydroxylase-related dioxygenase (phytanoyl-CoA dioxygenase family)
MTEASRYARNIHQREAISIAIVPSGHVPWAEMENTMNRSATDSTITLAPPDGGFVQAMHELGVDRHRLGADHRAQLDEQGWSLLPGVIDAAWLERLRARVDDQARAEGEGGGWEAHTEPGARRLADLVNKGEEFDRLWTHPLVLAAVAHVLARPFKLSSLNYREPMPGHGRQTLHEDWPPRGACEPFHVVNSIWLLDDFTAGNGASRVVPGTHRLIGRPGCDGHKPGGDHPRQVVITAPAGSVVVFNSHCWHGGMPNLDGTRRRALFAYYVAREHPRQQTDQAALLRVRTWRRLPRAARWLLAADE